MTLLPSPLAQSTLGEKCAFYLDHVTDSLSFLQSLRPRLDPVLTYSATSLHSIARALPFDADEQTTTACAAVLICIITVAVMSWTNPLSNLWRRSPSYASAPQVRDGDFSYIGPGDIVDPPSQGYSATADENEPDIICLRHRGTIYPLHFRAYAIDDGVLSVGALRHEAAAKMGVSNPNQVRLLYKGNLLKDDSRACKSEGLKQHSEVLCVVSEVGANTPSDVSDYDGRTSDPTIQRPGSSSSRLDGEVEPTRTTKKKSKKKNNNNNKKKNNRPAGGEDALGSSTSLAPPQPASDRPSTPMQPPNLKLIKTPLEQIAALVGYLQQELIPLCDGYVANPPTDPKKREFEYRKLSETILAQIMLKADGIEPDGNETVRNARKALIREAQANLNRLDQANR
ncbi:hypothetical protein N7448_003715 [Penicillium atrosanguineum]|uniref:BAG domain-containing protein n=2 Tax=Penicillium atrosanguineum TaxID=1132637 RepID=A0A9W9U522_9EURO|nr:hypothetical protein N7448_003715 [Penicillium atrosanguineum]KAJ5315739.1 hypothetical protein N7476_006046 [Penicillium atrosanguineum]